MTKRFKRLWIAIAVLVLMGTGATYIVAQTMPAVSEIWDNRGNYVGSILMGANKSMVFEGATDDGNELTLSPTDVGGDVTATLPGGGDSDYAIVPSSLTTNDVDVANSVWNASSGIVAEGATADGNELTMSFGDVPNDATFNMGNVMNASQVWLPQATGMPTTAAEAEDALAGDNNVVCYRYFNPEPMRLTEVVFYGMEVASAAGTDFLGVGIYDDADAGTQITEGTTAFATDGQANVVDVTDATLHRAWYRVCATQSDVSAFDWMAVALGTAETAINDDTVASEATFAAAANSATDGDMPDTTGALSATAEAKPIMRLQSN